MAITYSSRATAFVEDFETLDVWICLVLSFCWKNIKRLSFKKKKIFQFVIKSVECKDFCLLLS